jgi:hypothetical protein
MGLPICRSYGAWISSGWDSINRSRLRRWGGCGRKFRGSVGKLMFPHRPSGRIDNSPAFQRRDNWPILRIPKGRLKGLSKSVWE